MLGPGENEVGANEFVGKAKDLCEQGRLVEQRWRQLEQERERLCQQADTLQQLASSLAKLCRNAQQEAGDRAAQLLSFSSTVSAISGRLNVSSQSIRQDNVCKFPGLVQEPKTAAPEQSASCMNLAAQLSTRVLCRQGRYIVAYLERAMTAKDAACLPRLAEDLQRISSVLPSAKLKAICEQFVTATAIEDWTALEGLRLPLDEELSCIAGDTSNLVKAS